MGNSGVLTETIYQGAAAGDSFCAAEGMVGDEHQRLCGVGSERCQSHGEGVHGELRCLQDRGAFPKGRADDLAFRGDSGHANLAGIYEPAKFFEHVFILKHACGRTMHQEDVDVVCFQLAETGFETRSKRCDGKLARYELVGRVFSYHPAKLRNHAEHGARERLYLVLPSARISGKYAEFCTEDDRVATACREEFAEKAFAGSVSVGARGVVEGNSGVIGGAEGSEGFAASGSAQHGSAAKSDDGHVFQSGGLAGNVDIDCAHWILGPARGVCEAMSETHRKSHRKQG